MIFCVHCGAADAHQGTKRCFDGKQCEINLLKTELDETKHWLEVEKISHKDTEEHYAKCCAALRDTNDELRAKIEVLQKESVHELASCMGLKGMSEISEHVQKHAPWNGKQTCNTTSSHPD
jgi:hypothetical protein